jgi:hypothetical protein
VRSIDFSNLKFPPVPIEIMATFPSFAAEISLFPSVAKAVTCDDETLRVLTA